LVVGASDFVQMAALMLFWYLVLLVVRKFPCQQNLDFGHLIFGTKMDKNAVLSFSPDGDLLQEREIALRNCGFEVVSVQTEIQVRFEIEMGRCGVLVICFRVHLEKARDLTELFKKNCPDGCIIFVTNQTPEKAPQEVDYVVPDSGGPEAIVRALSDMGRSRLSKAT
jgi:hypothetical protein